MNLIFFLIEKFETDESLGLMFKSLTEPIMVEALVNSLHIEGNFLFVLS